MVQNEVLDDAMLPDGWLWATLGEVADYINGRAFKPSEWEEHGRPIIRIQNLTGSTNVVNRFSKPVDEKFIIQDGQFLISWSATLGAFIYRGEEAVLNQHIFKVRAFIDKMYLFYLTTAYLQELKQKVHGSGMQHITKGRFEQSAIPLAPLPEQPRIVAAIETQLTRLEVGVAALNRAQANLRRYRASVLKAACEGRLLPPDEVGAIRESPDYEPADVLLERILTERRAKWEAENPGKKYKEPEPPDTSDLPELPEGWVWTNAGELGEVSGGLTKNQKRAQYPMHLPYLRVANVYADELRLDDIRTVGVRESELDRITLTDGDLLIVEGNGSIEQIGRVAIWNGSIHPCVHQNHLIKVRFEPTELGQFVLRWLLSNQARDHVIRVASSTSGLYTLSISKVSALPIPLPPFAEQHRIVAEVERRLSVVAELEKQVQAALQRAERLRQAILKHAFEGKLVPQDPNDEPASALLARIKAARSGKAGKGKRGKTEQLALL